MCVDNVGLLLAQLKSGRCLRRHHGQIGTSVEALHRSRYRIKLLAQSSLPRKEVPYVVTESRIKSPEKLGQESLGTSATQTLDERWTAGTLCVIEALTRELHGRSRCPRKPEQGIEVGATSTMLLRRPWRSRRPGRSEGRRMNTLACSHLPRTLSNDRRRAFLARRPSKGRSLEGRGHTQGDASHCGPLAYPSEVNGRLR